MIGDLVFRKIQQKKVKKEVQRDLVLMIIALKKNENHIKT